MARTQAVAGVGVVRCGRACRAWWRILWRRLRATVRALLGQVQPPVDQSGQVQALGQDRGRDSPAFGTRFDSSKLSDTRLRSWSARTQQVRQSGGL